MTAVVSLDDKIAAIKAYAADNRCYFEPEGQCGFGRECVGLIHDGSYPDYGPEVWTPEDAYHKSDCVAVLGRGAHAVEQLYEWVEWFKANDYVLALTPRTPTHSLDAMLHGFETATFVKRSQ